MSIYEIILDFMRTFAIKFDLRRFELACGREISTAKPVGTNRPANAVAVFCLEPGWQETLWR